MGDIKSRPDPGPSGIAQAMGAVVGRLTGESTENGINKMLDGGSSDTAEGAESSAAGNVAKATPVGRSDYYHDQRR